MDIIKELRQLRKDQKNIGADLTLWSLINILIRYFTVEKRNMDRRLQELNPYDSLNTRPRKGR